MKLWVVGKTINATGTEWQFCGVFDTEEKAIAVCTTEDHFVGPVDLNFIVPPDITTEWPKAYYPLIEEDKEKE